MADLDPETIATGALIAFLAAITLFYNVISPDISVAGIDATAETAFWVAGVSWIVLYVSCNGRDWTNAEGWEKGIFALSWFLLLAVQFETAILDEAIVEPFLTSETLTISGIQLGVWGAIAIHGLSAYLTWANRG